MLCYICSKPTNRWTSPSGQALYPAHNSASFKSSQIVAHSCHSVSRLCCCMTGMRTDRLTSASCAQTMETVTTRTQPRFTFAYNPCAFTAHCQHFPISSWSDHRHLSLADASIINPHLPNHPTIQLTIIYPIHPHTHLPPLLLDCADLFFASGTTTT